MTFKVWFVRYGGYRPTVHVQGYEFAVVVEKIEWISLKTSAEGFRGDERNNQSVWNFSLKNIINTRAILALRHAETFYVRLLVRIQSLLFLKSVVMRQ